MEEEGEESGEEEVEEEKSKLNGRKEGEKADQRITESFWLGSLSPRSGGVSRKDEVKKRRRRERRARAAQSSHSISMLRSSRKAEKVPSWYRRKLLCRDQCRTSPSLSQSPKTPGEAPQRTTGEGGSAFEPLQSTGPPQAGASLPQPGTT